MDKVRQQALKPNWHDFSKWDTGQKRGEERPALIKAYPEEAQLIDLTPIDHLKVEKFDLFEAICNRQSVRKYSDQEISFDHLTYLLIATNGVLDPEKPTRRTAPSAGARHAIETYIYVKDVESLDCGLYRYLPHEHKLLLVHKEMISPIENEKRFTFGAPLTFMWTAVPYRMSWRYGHASEKLLLLDAGHICQNLYLACEGLELGTCAVGAYDQDGLDAYMKLDGDEEMLIYAAPVGHKIL